MTDQTDKPKLGTRPPLGLKRTVETGKVKQSFSHGRSNTVVVEVKKRRILGKPGEAPPAPEPKVEAAAPAPKPAAPARRKSAPISRPARPPNSIAMSTFPRRSPSRSWPSAWANAVPIWSRHCSRWEPR